jgi:hypothetical protein
LASASGSLLMAVILASPDGVVVSPVLALQHLPVAASMMNSMPTPLPVLTPSVPGMLL